jgi:hypothetical protein
MGKHSNINLNAVTVTQFKAEAIIEHAQKAI